MCLSLVTLMSILRTGSSILVEEINFVTVFPSQTILHDWLSYLDLWLWLTQPFSLICLFLLTLVFVLQWFSLHLEILIMLLLQLPFTFFQTQSWLLLFIAQFLIIRFLIFCIRVFDYSLTWSPERCSMNGISKLASAASAAAEYCEWV